MSSPTSEPTPKVHFLRCRQMREECGYSKQKTATLRRVSSGGRPLLFRRNLLANAAEVQPERGF